MLPQIHKSQQADEDVAIAVRMKGKPKELSKIKCFNCGKMGHFSLRCALKTRDDKKGKRKEKQIVASAEIDDLFRRLEEEDFAMISHFSQGIIKRMDGTWIVVRRST